MKGRHRRSSATAAPAAALAAGLAAAMLLAAAAPAARAAYFGKNKVQTSDLAWQTLVTPHFEIHHAAGSEELAVQASLIAEQAYREYADRLDHELARRVPFILYSSPHDFAQTNIADELIGEGIGGFTEAYRNRMVLPYPGSHEEFVHVVRHELVHAFMFDVAFGSSRAIGARSPFFSIPYWYAEGMAEWLSSGWDANADMFVRDATINDYLAPLEYVGGYMAYKQGQAAMRLLSARYGDEKLVELWRRVGRVRSVERAVEQCLGLKMEDLDELYAKELRKRYWPSYADLEAAEDIARPLTDHEEEQGGYNQRPALSPDGDLVAFFSDRDGLTSLYLMSALDGKVLRRLVQGERSSRFESFHSFRSGISFDPSGREVALVAKSGNAERLLTIAVASGEVTRSLRLELDAASSPAWSPDGRRVAVVGTRFGRTDLYLVDLGGDGGADLAGAVGPARPLPDGGSLIRLTDDIGDEGPPAWSPDGERLAFVFDPRAEIDYEFALDERGRRRLLWARPRDGGAPASLEAAAALDTAGAAGAADTSGVAGATGAADTSGVEGAAGAGGEPAGGGAGGLGPGGLGPGGGRLVVLNPATGERWLPGGERGDYRDPVWVGPGALCVVDERTGIANLALVELDSAGTSIAAERRLTNVLGGLFQPAYAARADRLIFTGFHAGGFDLYTAERFRAEWSRRVPGGAAPGAVTQELPGLVSRQAPPDSVADAARVGLIEPYRSRLTIDPSGGFGAGGVYYTSAGGLGLANQISFSDLLGDNRLGLLLNFYGSVSNSDLAATYYYLRRRVDLGVGLFHYKNYYSSAITSVGELLPGDTFFSERNYGLYGVASYPFSTFRRLDLELELMRSQRTLLDIDPTGQYLIATDERTVTLAQPSLSFVHDSAFFGGYGPVTGSRLVLSWAPALPLGGEALRRQTFALDARRYWQPFRRNTLALRLIGAVSDGSDSRKFVLGGPFTLRGYRFYDFETIDKLAGSKLAMANFEYRLPFVDYLIFGWPSRWGLSGLGGTLFFDIGAAWDGKLRMFGPDDRGRTALRDLRADYGLGLRTRLSFLAIKLDWAWKTDLRRHEGAVFHFSIGPEF